MLQKVAKYIFRILSREKFPNSFDEIRFKFENIIHFLTWRCNSKCITCNCWETPSFEKEKEVWNVNNIKKFYSTIKTNSVYFTGGEPLIIPDFKEIAETAYKASGATISFTTNSLAVEKTKNDLFCLKKRKIPFFVEFSCNGFEKIHDLSRGIKGNYKKVLILKEFCEKNDIQFSLSYTIFPFNIDETISFVKYWKKRNINVGLGIGRVDQRYRLEKENEKYLFFEKKDILKLEEILFQLSKIYPKYLPQFYFVKGIKESKKIFPCFGLIKRLVIDPYGNIYPCDGLIEKLCLGNLKETNFDFSKFLLLKKDRIKKVFEIIRDRKCQPCLITCDLLFGINLILSKKDLIKIFYSELSQKLKTWIKKQKNTKKFL